MRKEVIGDATLYLGDCREVEVACDLLLTDPPYGQGYKSGRTDEWGAIKGDDDLAGVQERLAHVLKGLRRGRHVYIFGNRFDFSALPLCSVAELIWTKETSVSATSPCRGVHSTRRSPSRSTRSAKRTARKASES